MAGTEQVDPTLGSHATDRLESWKEIAAYLSRDVRTVQRWEQRESLPVHRLPHDKLASVYAFKSELDAWREGGRSVPVISRDPPIPRVWLAAAVIAPVALAAVSWLAWRPARVAIGSIGTAVQLTASVLPELFPSISPDGRWLAYAAGTGGAADVFLQAIGSERATNLTADSSVEDTQPAFSADGRSIAFRSDRGGGGIFVMDLMDRSVRRVATRGFNPAWSPDGASIAYATESYVAAPDTRMVDSQLWIVNLRTGEERRLPVADAMQPAWSPGGRRIAYWGLRPTGQQRDVWTIDVVSGAAAAVTEDTAMDWNPVWSADGRSLYFLSNRSGSSHWNLYRAAIDEATGRRRGDVEPLTLPAAKVVSVSIGPAGTITWSSLQHDTNVQRVAFDPVRRAVTGAPVAVTSTTRRFDAADVMRDGAWLVMVESNTGALYVSRADGSEHRRITQGSGYHRNPRWSTDGRRIAFYGDLGDGHISIWMMERDGSRLVRLTEPSDNLAYPLWSPDGRDLACTDVAGQWRIIGAARNGSSSAVRRFESHGGFDPHAWSPDGRTIAGARVDAEGRVVALAIFDLGSRRYRTVATAGDVATGTLGEGVAWMPDGRHLIGIADGRLMLFDTTSGAITELLNLAPDAISWPTVPADGRTVFFTREQLDADVWSTVLRDASGGSRR